jgi:hypothetical protein
MNILATPFRYLDIAFLAFDITGDGEIEAKVTKNKNIISDREMDRELKNIYHTIFCFYIKRMNIIILFQEFLKVMTHITKHTGNLHFGLIIPKY